MTIHSVKGQDMPHRIAYFGPQGTFTEEAALLYKADATPNLAAGAELLAFPSISAVADAVETGLADEGVIPIENSLEGSVTATLDLLIHDSRLAICHELVLPIVQCLLGKPGAGADRIRVIYSHPQSLGQCRRFIEQRFPHAQVEASMSNATAVEEMMRRDDAAAIGPRRAGVIYGAEVLAEDIADHAANVTRFVVLGHRDHEPTGRDKTSLCFALRADRAGALVEALHEFSDRGINLAKIESRPSKEVLGKYVFLVDLEGHRENPVVAAALAGVRTKTDPDWFKVFGSYPRYGSNGG